MTQFAVPSACPTCHRPESWSVWIGKSGYPMGTCHRALCAFGSRQLEGISIPTPKKKEPRHFTRPIAPLTEDQQRLLEGKYDLDPGLVDGYSYWDDRFVLPVFGPIGYNRRGVIAYSLSGRTPKSLPYNEKPDEPFIHWAKPVARVRHLVVVEDWFSAEKVASTNEAMGIAIMGTHIHQGQINELVLMAGHYDATTWIALDRDAFPKTIQYIASYREQFPRGLFAWSLRQDLKYETRERISAALAGATDFGTTHSGVNDEGQICL